MGAVLSRCVRWGHWGVSWRGSGSGGVGRRVGSSSWVGWGTRSAIDLSVQIHGMVLIGIRYHEEERVMTDV